jgi:hypothetical protein
MEGMRLDGKRLSELPPGLRDIIGATMLIRFAQFVGDRVGIDRSLLDPLSYQGLAHHGISDSDVAIRLTFSFDERLSSEMIVVASPNDILKWIDGLNLPLADDGDDVKSAVAIDVVPQFATLPFEIHELEHLAVGDIMMLGHQSGALRALLIGDDLFALRNNGNGNYTLRNAI